MRVFKFGGASVKSADAVKNVAKIIRLFPDTNLVVVVSAMGKTTNALEAVVNAWFYGEGDPSELVPQIAEFHAEIMDGLDMPETDPTRLFVAETLAELGKRTAKSPTTNYDFEYDQIVSLGEIMSTRIVNDYLQRNALDAQWFDSRKLIRTDRTFREGKVDWELSTQLIGEAIGTYLAAGNARVAVTQGFLGHTETGDTVTLGREGSDYTGAILAWALDAADVTIWKDVPGMLNADPKWFDSTVRLPRISYREAIELAYYGATVIHPKTLKPLQNKQIPLYVKSFVDPDLEGTVIQASMASDNQIPSFIFKMNQVLISISPRDFSFMVEENFSDMYQIFAEERVKINLMQNSALNLLVSVDDTKRVPRLLERLNEKYVITHEKELELVTIRHYDQETIDRVTVKKETLVEQRSRFTARMVMRGL